MRTAQALALFIALTLLMSCNKYYVVTGDVDENERLYFGNFIYLRKAPANNGIYVCVTNTISKDEECSAYLAKNDTAAGDQSDVNEDGSKRPISEYDVFAFSASKNDTLAITGFVVQPMFGGGYAHYKLDTPVALNKSSQYDYFGTFVFDETKKTLVLLNDYEANAHWGIKKYQIPPSQKISKQSGSIDIKLNTLKAGTTYIVPTLR